MNNEEYTELTDNSKVYQAAIKTPLEPAKKLSEKLSREILMKREDLQPVFSFKIRGAANRIFSASEEEIHNGVICSSAGNHAQGVALAASKRNTAAHIVMPESAPEIKVQAVEALGGKVTLHGHTYDECQDKALEMAEEQNLCFIHPFNDPLVIAGQGTIAKELLNENNKISAIFIPIGGGGLAAGISAYIKNSNPNIKIIGVEPANSASMEKALKENKPTPLEHVGIFADGVAVKKVGEESFKVCQKNVDEMIQVTTDETCAAIQQIFEETRTIVEPAGALAIAGINKYFAENPDSDLGRDNNPVVAINSGANINFDRLRHISERASIGTGKESLLATEIPERKGSFLEFIKQIGNRQITEFNYRYTPSTMAKIFLGFENSRDASSKTELIEQLTTKGYKVHDLTNNELAILHIRHLAAGSGTKVDDERIFRFQFPEQTGALSKFLESVGRDWNITLFHYRNHGSDYGRVLAGIQVPKETEDEFQRHLDQLGYYYQEETENEAYKLFLE